MSISRLSSIGDGLPIVVAMSGGVDSSVAAGLLCRAGHRVIGITLQLYDDRKRGRVSATRGKSCCAGRDIYDAKLAARALGIPHYVLDFESRFQESVIDDFLAGYRRGETPLPCVRCNQRIKFDALLDVARGLGAGGLATGHYARIEETSGELRLLCACDGAKDQSYFLFATTMEQLAFLHFPLGGMDKRETREIARSMGLPNADKRESQDICFVADRYTQLFPEFAGTSEAGTGEKGENVNKSSGSIRSLDGELLGRHGGIAGYTIGQRRGLGLGGLSQPLYVVDIDVGTNTVYVGERAALAVRGVVLREVNWLCNGIGNGIDGQPIRVKFRSLMDSVAARISLSRVSLAGKGEFLRAEVIFAEAQLAVACGQACVFYGGDRVLGGGIIDRTLKRDTAWVDNSETCLAAAE